MSINIRGFNINYVSFDGSWNNYQNIKTLKHNCLNDLTNLFFYLS